VIVFVTANVFGSRKRIVAVPSLMMIDRPSVVSPHPSPSYLNSPVLAKVFGS